MSGNFIIAYALWSLVVAPALCRAGTLTECCSEKSPCRDSGGDAECSEIGCSVPDQLPLSQSNGHQCSSCADVSRVQTKPSDELGGSVQLAPATHTTGEQSPRMKLSGGACADLICRRTAKPRLPFPPSDVPRLI
jgi:hypothetical protein